MSMGASTPLNVALSLPAHVTLRDQSVEPPNVYLNALGHFSSLSVPPPPSPLFLVTETSPAQRRSQTES